MVEKWIARMLARKIRPAGRQVSKPCETRRADIRTPWLCRMDDEESNTARPRWNSDDDAAAPTICCMPAALTVLED